MSLARKLCDFASCYDHSHGIWMKRVGLTLDDKDLVKDSYQAMIFYTTYIHERQGSNPRFPLYHREALKRAMNGKNFDDILVSDNSFPEKVWKHFQEMSGKGTNPKITKGVVSEILYEMRNEHETNIINLLKNKNLLEAFRWLDGIRGIGPKLASFFLRDIWSFVGEWKNVPESSLRYLQPIDRWIRFWSKRCWPDIDWKSNSKEKEFSKRVTEECLNAKINPVAFNKGAWFAGSHFRELSWFFSVPEENQVEMEKCILGFSASEVVEAMKRFDEYSKQRMVYPIT